MTRFIQSRDRDCGLNPRRAAASLPANCTKPPKLIEFVQLLADDFRFPAVAVHRNTWQIVTPRYGGLRQVTLKFL